MGCASGVAAIVKHVDSVDPVRDAATFEQEYSLGRIIGKGAFGKVHAASHRATGKHCAVKCIEMVDDNLSQEKQTEQAAIKLKKARNEIDLWQAVGKHPNIVEFHGWFIEQPSTFLMVMEKCSCTVTEKLSSGDIRKSANQWLVREMLLGVEACHLANVVHRDIKMDNFLVSNTGGRHIKLCDFGLAARLKPGAGGPSLKGETGTPPLMSPEMVTGELYGTSTDVWSFGAMVYFAGFRELPYVPKEMTAKAAKEAIRVGEPSPRFLEGVPRPRDKVVVAFLQGLLQRDPADRVTAMEALQHPYVEEQFKPISGQIDTASTLAPLEDHADCLSSAISQAACELSQ